MKVLWLCNIVLPELCEEFGFKKVNAGGWLTGMWNEMKKQSNLQLGICVPIYNLDRMKDGQKESYLYYSFHVINKESMLEEQVSRFCEIIERFKPDIVHIWGTEYIHSYAMVLAAQKRGLSDNIVINIQGILSMCVLHYANYLPESIVKEELLGKSIMDDIKDFQRRSVMEQKCLQLAKNIIGRTTWDRACVKQLALEIRYFYCNEILRKTFYQNIGSWSFDCCELHTIFISQANYPIKGFHIFIKGLEIIKRRYPDVKVYIAGNNLNDDNTSYALFIKSEIMKYNLENNIQFLGVISEEIMCEYYKKCNVFVSPSVIENSPNSICEAAMIGIPIVASYVGGVPSLITHEEEGYLYSSDEFYMMAHYVCEIFKNKTNICERLSKNAVQKMLRINDIKTNSERNLEIYKTILRIME